MKAEEFQQALRRMPLAGVETVTGGQPFVVLAPHPDDESLGLGGLIAAAAGVGQRVDIAILTHGEGSHRHSKTYPAATLGALRGEEARRAAALLGVVDEHLVHMDLPDAAVPSEGPSFDATVDRLEAMVETSGARSMFVTWAHDPHCDHEAADTIARALRARRPGLKLWSYPIWGWHLPPGALIDAPPPHGFRIDISRWAAAKHAAIAAHESQMTDLIGDDPEGFRFTPETLAPFLGPFEYVFEVPAEDQQSRKWLCPTGSDET